MRTFNAGADVKTLLAATIVLGLSACGQQSGNTAATVEGAAIPADQSMLRPGKWEMTVEDVTAASPTMGENPVPTELPKSRSYCLSAEDAAAITPETLTNPGGSGRACKREAWDVSGGNINAQLICPGMDDIKEVAMRISGSYSREEYRVTTVSRVFGIDFEQRIEAHRVGECQR
ncbi:MAG: DUF3617 family protein [Pseudomonadota bacterium]